MQLLSFKRAGGTGFDFVFEKDLEANETILVRMPSISANKRGVNDIGWMSNGDVTLYGTLAENPKSENALWQEIREHDEVNKVTSVIKIVNNGKACRIEMRAILN